MTKPDYSQFDAHLLSAISGGENRMAVLEQNRVLIELAKPFCINKPGSYPQPEWRVIDRRLQALRKAGKIIHDGKAWTIAC